MILCKKVFFLFLLAVEEVKEKFEEEKTKLEKLDPFKMADVLRNASKRIKILHRKKSSDDPDAHAPAHDPKRSPRPQRHHTSGSGTAHALDAQREAEIYKVFQTFDLDGKDVSFLGGTAFSKQSILCESHYGRPCIIDAGHPPRTLWNYKPSFAGVVC